MTNISSIQMTLTFNIDLEAVAELLEITPEEAYNLWNEGDLKDRIDDELDIFDILHNAEDLEEYGGLEVGSGFYG